jgi:hypothetical protein
MVACAVLCGAGALGAQAPGTTTFNAPYRAFDHSEFGVYFSLPGDPLLNTRGTAFEGFYRLATAGFDIGFKAGILNPPAPRDHSMLLGIEARQRVLTHGRVFPIDAALVLGVGGELTSGHSQLIVPAGISLGHRFDPNGTGVSVEPYLQPTLLTTVEAGTRQTVFAMGVGVDVRLTRGFDMRLGSGLGGMEGGSLGVVWVH